MKKEQEAMHSAPYRMWGNMAEESSIKQMEDACSLPIAVKGALMPDAHYGYGLPIGGVLATKDAVIPYAVGMDIACRMCMTGWPAPGPTYSVCRNSSRPMKTRTLIEILAATALVCFATLTPAAEPPGILNHQGRIAVAGSNYDGTGF